jgi:hypothetical protein
MDTIKHQIFFAIQICFVIEPIGAQALKLEQELECFA